MDSNKAVQRPPEAPQQGNRTQESAMPDQRLLQIEKNLATAHRALWSAAASAESLRDQGLCDDLYGLAAEVGRLNTAMLKDKRPPRLATATVRI